MARFLYRRTEAGRLAWQRQDTRVPLEYRRVLGVIEGETHPDNLRARLPGYTADGLIHLLDELVEQGFLATSEAEEHHDLDFTGEFSIPDLSRPPAGGEAGTKKGSGKGS
jgi:hypothetical protein